jgi:thiol-disulfide isomerase/thioredoxin
METGIVGLPAPPLENVRWINENGDERSPLTLAELGQKILYFFQDWCAGCHRHGFPTFVTLAEELRDMGVGLAAIQTVFEGSEVNTFDRLRENQRRYGLRVPFGHAVADSALLIPLP